MISVICPRVEVADHRPDDIARIRDDGHPSMRGTRNKNQKSWPKRVLGTWPADEVSICRLQLPHSVGKRLTKLVIRKVEVSYPYEKCGKHQHSITQQRIHNVRSRKKSINLNIYIHHGSTRAVTYTGYL